MPDRRWPSAGVRRSGAASARCPPRVTSTATRAGDVLWLALASGCSVARWLGVPPCSRRGVVAVAHVLPCSHAGLPRVRLCGGSSASPLEGCSRARRRAAVARSLARRHAAVAPLRSFVSNHVALSLRTTTLPFAGGITFVPFLINPSVVETREKDGERGRGSEKEKEIVALFKLV